MDIRIKHENFERIKEHIAYAEKLGAKGIILQSKIDFERIKKSSNSQKNSLDIG
jgi:sugar phosphate isomerase/epimerase